MGRIISVNRVYLVTLLFYQVAGTLLVNFVDNYLLRLVLLQLILVTPAGIYLLWSGGVRREDLAIRKLSFGAVMLTVCFTLCIRPLLTLVNALSMLVADYTISDSMADVATQTPFPLMFLCVAIVPAIFEELVYRGVFFQEYRKKSPIAGAMMSGLLFGLMHGNLNQFCYAFLLGVIFALVIEATGSIASSMLMHLTINGSSVILMYVLPYIEKLLARYSEVGEGQLTQRETVLTLELVLRTYLVPAIVATALAVVVYRELVAVCGRKEQVKAAFAGERKVRHFAELWTVPLYIAAVILIGNMILVELGA